MITNIRKRRGRPLFFDKNNAPIFTGDEFYILHIFVKTYVDACEVFGCEPQNAHQLDANEYDCKLKKYKIVSCKNNKMKCIQTEEQYVDYDKHKDCDFLIYDYYFDDSKLIEYFLKSEFRDIEKCSNEIEFFINESNEKYLGYANYCPISIINCFEYPENEKEEISGIYTGKDYFEDTIEDIYIKKTK